MVSDFSPVAEAMGKRNIGLKPFKSLQRALAQTLLLPMDLFTGFVAIICSNYSFISHF
jgi:hypothetical protein